MITNLLLIAAAFLAGIAVTTVGYRRWNQLMAAALCCFVLSELFRRS